MATINVRQQADCELFEPIGSMLSAAQITVGEKAAFELVLAAGASNYPWTAGFNYGLEITSFDFLWVETDVEVSLLLVTDSQAAGGGAKYSYAFVVPGIGFLLASNKGFGADDTGTWDGTATDVIDQIAVKNTSGSTATVKIVLAKAI